MLVKKIQQADLGERVVTDGQLARLLDGSPQKRYNLVNRALHRVSCCTFGGAVILWHQPCRIEKFIPLF